MYNLNHVVNEAIRRAKELGRDYRVSLIRGGLMIRPACDPFCGEGICMVRQTGTIQWQSREAANEYIHGVQS